jgi:hypothetical protein
VQCHGESSACGSNHCRQCRPPPLSAWIWELPRLMVLLPHGMQQHPQNALQPECEPGAASSSLHQSCWPSVYNSKAHSSLGPGTGPASSL